MFRRLRENKWVWLGFFAALLAVQAAWVMFSYRFCPDDPVLLTGFRGNMISGIVGGFMFLFLAFFLGSGIERIQTETHALTVQRAAQDKDRQKIGDFKAFEASQTYHGALFPDLTGKLNDQGFEYIIEPVRDSTGAPLRRVTEMDDDYLVRIRSISYPSQRGEDNLREYEKCPIRIGDHYFCRFFNGDWHMNRESAGGEWHRFLLSGKVGPVEYGMTANEFVTRAMKARN